MHYGDVWPNVAFELALVGGSWLSCMNIVNNKNDFEDAKKSLEIRCAMYSGSPFASKINPKTLQKES